MTKTPQSGSWTVRWLIRLFTVLFGLLVYWLLGFFIDDIGHWPGPDYSTLEEQMLAPELTQQSRQRGEQLEEVRREITAQQARQVILRDSTSNAQTTMNQLLQFQQLSLEKGVTPTEQEQLALAESQQRFLTNQKQYQQLTEEISRLQEQQRGLEAQQRDLESQLQIAREPVRNEYQRLARRHDLWLASIKLAVLTPLLILGVVLFLRQREGIYMPLFAAFAVAVAAKVMLVMHEYFPARYFKYILIITFLIIVTKALLGLLRSLAFPRREWLHKQYREAYEAFLCPICNFPIRRGPLKYLFWTRRSIRKLHVPVPGTEADAPYCCPACGTSLFAECRQCHQIRHTLLPTCEHCGATDAVMNEESPAPAGAS